MRVLTPSRRRALLHGAVVGGLIFFAWHYTTAGLGFDAFAYWSVDLANPYGGVLGGRGFFPYSPAIALIAEPLGLLPWPAFLAVWTALLLAAVVWLGRRHFLVLLAFPPVAAELVTGNIHLLMAAAIVIGFRFPAAWSFILLTKASSGVGLLWFVARGEWRKLAVAVGVTLSFAALSFLFLPTLWSQWFDLLTRSAGQESWWVPTWLRVAAAVAIVWWGARRDAYWTVPLAATIALPVLWVAGLSMLVACWSLSGPRRRYYVPDARQPGNSVTQSEADDHPAGLQRGAADRLGAG